MNSKWVIEAALSTATPASENGEDPLYLEEIVDLHTQTNCSDGEQTVADLISEMYRNGVYLAGVSDHVNIGDELKEYISSFLNRTDYVSGGEEESFSDVHLERYTEAIVQYVDDSEDIVLWQEADEEKLKQDWEVLREYEGEYSLEELRESDVLNYDMVVMNAVEPDFNPLTELEDNKQDKQKEFERYTDKLKDFLVEAEENDAKFDHVNQPVHDIFVDDKFRYVKDPELFADLSEEQKLKVWMDYAEKLTYVVDELSPVLDDLDVTVSLAHPAIIERNEELMDIKVFDSYRQEKAQKEVKDFVFGHKDIPIPGSEVNPEDRNLGMEHSLNEMITDEEVSKIYPEEPLRDYWKPLAEKLAEADNIVGEVNGKHVERFHRSVLWDLYNSYIPGSDQHREGEQQSRSRRTKNLDFDAEIETPIDMLETDME